MHVLKQCFKQTNQVGKSTKGDSAPSGQTLCCTTKELDPKTEPIFGSVAAAALTNVFLLASQFLYWCTAIAKSNRTHNPWYGYMVAFLVTLTKLG